MSKVRNIKEDAREKLGWADLPQDLLEKITRLLACIDQIRVRSTCRNWTSVAMIPPLKRLPWIMTSDKPWPSYTLYDPSDKKSFDIKIEEDDPINHYLSVFCASKFGWLLVYCSPRRKLVFFNPFKKEVIEKLPEIDLSMATFSSPPTDSECMIFAFGNSSRISICGLNDISWRTYEWGLGAFGEICSAIYSGRNLYFTDTRALMMFNIDTVDLKFLAIAKPDENHWRNDGYLDYNDGTYDSYLVDSNGEIILILVKLSKKSSRFQILKPDFLEMEWVEVTRLKNQTLFLNRASSFAVHSTERELVDTVHTLSRGKLKLYSLKADQIHSCSERIIEEWELPIPVQWPPAKPPDRWFKGKEDLTFSLEGSWFVKHCGQSPAATVIASDDLTDGGFGVCNVDFSGEVIVDDG
ncbi:F-box protein At3g56470-like [Cornus florida]|uniref:F-box protein At3g56470-like n=1 Tax=Cornus florida TaxID=4283 RepID=UPI002899CCB6|nr:F-box protein At3g56470-like [Cornus florida]